MADTPEKPPAEASVIAAATAFSGFAAEDDILCASESSSAAAPDQVLWMHGTSRCSMPLLQLLLFDVTHSAAYKIRAGCCL